MLLVLAPHILTAGGEKIWGVKHRLLDPQRANVSNFQTPWSGNGSTRCPKEQSDACLWGCLEPWLGSGFGRAAWPVDDSNRWQCHIGFKGLCDTRLPEWC